MKLSAMHMNGSSLMEIVKKNISIVLWVFLLVMVLLVGYIVFQEVQKVSQAQTDTSGVMGQIVRVNLARHAELEKRLQDNEQFVPTGIPGADAFSVAPSEIEAP